jgi:hypothetical protein
LPPDVHTIEQHANNPIEADGCRPAMVFNRFVASIEHGTGSAAVSLGQFSRCASSATAPID